MRLKAACIQKVKMSMCFTFGISAIRTFGQLTDHIISKIKLQSQDDCTDQQAFYKLQKAIETTKADKWRIEPKSQLTDVFPRHNRRKEIKEIERRLRVNLEALIPHPMVTNALLLCLLSSVVVLFMNWAFGVAGFVLAIGGLWISERMGTEFKDKTIGELTTRMTQLNYIKSRRQPETINVKEIPAKLERLFTDSLGLDEQSMGGLSK